MTVPNAAYAAGIVQAGTTPTLICTGDTRLIQNTGSITAYLGGPTVTATTGYPLPAGAPITIPPGDGVPRDLYAITAASNTTIAYLQP